MDWVIDNSVGLQLDVRAIADECRVQSRECMLVEPGDLAEVALDPRIPGFDDAGEAVDANRVSESRVRRKLLGEHAVQKYQRVPANLPETEALDIGRRDSERIDR